MEGCPRYTIMPKTCLEYWAETTGVARLSDEIHESLSEDVTYRLRELINNALLVMKHCKRKCLSVDDVNMALRQSSSEPIYGHGGINSTTFKALSFKECKICYIDEKEINLRDTALEPVYPADVGQTSVKANWLVLGGNVCTNGQLKDGIASTDPMEECFTTYLDEITKAILSNNDRHKKIALQDLGSNQKLQPVLPHLISFLCAQLKDNSQAPTYSRRCELVLTAIRALIANRTILLAPYVFQLVEVLLFVVNEAPINVTHWSAKTRAAILLSILSRKHTYSVSYLPQQLMKAYRENLNTSGKPLSSVFGSVVGITVMGPEAIRELLYPNISERITILDELMLTASNLETHREIISVRTAIADAVAVYLKSIPSTEQSENLSASNGELRVYNNIYKELYEGLSERFLFRCIRANVRTNDEDATHSTFPERHALSSHPLFTTHAAKPSRASTKQLIAECAASTAATAKDGRGGEMQATRPLLLSGEDDRSTDAEPTSNTFVKWNHRRRKLAVTLPAFADEGTSIGKSSSDETSRTPGSFFGEDSIQTSESPCKKRRFMDMTGGMRVPLKNVGRHAAMRRRNKRVNFHELERISLNIPIL